MRAIKDSTTLQNVLPHYLVKPMTSKIDVISRHNEKKILIFLEMFNAAHSYRLPGEFPCKAGQRED